MKHVKAYDSGAFNAVTVLCNHDLSSSSKAFSSPPNKILHPMSRHSLCPFPQPLETTGLLSVCVDLFILDVL